MLPVFYFKTLKKEIMTKYGKKSQEKVEKAMHEMKQGTLRSGSGDKVTNPKQAVAIGLSEARKEGGKVPAAPGKKKTGTGAKASRSSSSGTKKTGSSRSASGKKAKA